MNKHLFILLSCSIITTSIYTMKKEVRPADEAYVARLIRLPKQTIENINMVIESGANANQLMNMFTPEIIYEFIGHCERNKLPLPKILKPVKKGREKRKAIKAAEEKEKKQWKKIEKLEKERVAKEGEKRKAEREKRKKLKKAKLKRKKELIKKIREAVNALIVKVKTSGDSLEKAKEKLKKAYSEEALDKAYNVLMIIMVEKGEDDITKGIRTKIIKEKEIERQIKALG